MSSKIKPLIYIFPPLLLLLGLFLFLPRGIPADLQFLGDQPPYTTHMADVFGRSYFDLFPYHHQFLDFYDQLSQDKIITNSPKTLILIDYHSDMYVNNDHLDKNFEGPGNWLNPLLSQIDEVYWVLPDSTLAPAQKSILWDRQEITTNKAYIDGPQDLTISLSSTGYLEFGTPSAKPQKQVILHKRLLRDLPSFSQSSSQILLTIDADFFAYNGAEADQFAYVPQEPAPAELEKQMSSLIDTLYEKDIRPVMVGCSQSTKYTLETAQNTIEKFYRYLSLYSQNRSDYLLYYRHDDTPSGRYTNLMYGVNQKRDYFSSAKFDLQTVDLLSSSPDSLISLNSDGPELKTALKLLMYQKKISLPQTWLTLRYLSSSAQSTPQTINLSSYF